MSKVDTDGNAYVSVISLRNKPVIITAGTHVGLATNDFEAIENSKTVELKYAELKKEVKQNDRNIDKLNSLKLGNELLDERKARLLK